MLSSITTTTTTTTTMTTTVAAAAGLSYATVYGALAVCILIVLLISKELLSAYGEEADVTRRGGDTPEGARQVTSKSLARNLSAAIYPLLFCFALMVTVTVIGVL